MKERGMIFNGEMVRSILDGRKTQTRRVVTPQPLYRHGHFYGCGDRTGLGKFPFVKCRSPFQPGDRIWVRETWGNVSYEFGDDNCMVDYVPDRPAKAVHEKPFGNGYYSGHVIYAADGGFTWCDDDGCVDGRSCWKPSAQMPRWASRITLEITGIRVERLQDLTDEDAALEGSPKLEHLPYNPQDPKKGRTWFRGVWSGIYGEESWQSNPWVWVIEFKVVSDEG